MSLELEWTGQEEFSQKPFESWLVNDKVVGGTRSAQGLTFATINGAGHMVSRAQ